jgi:hypothetical protein
VVGAAALLEHKSWDYKIVLQAGKQLLFGPLYLLTGKELVELQETLDKLLEKGYTLLSELPGASPILFVDKKPRELQRMCVNY